MTDKNVFQWVVFSFVGVCATILFFLVAPSTSEAAHCGSFTHPGDSSFPCPTPSPAPAPAPGPTPAPAPSGGGGSQTVSNPNLVGDPGGVVPCSGRDCGTCQLVVLGNRVVGVLITIMIAGTMILFAWAGFWMVTSRGSQSEYQRAKNLLQNVIIGLIIMLVAWLAVDTVLKALLANNGQVNLSGTGTAWGPWNQIPQSACTSQFALQDGDVTVQGNSWTGRLSASALNQAAMTDQQIADLVSGAAALPAGSGLCAYASANNIPCTVMQSLILNESTNCTNEVSPAGAYGCGQLLISTARSLDPAGFANMTDAEVRQVLIDNDDLNMRLSTQYFSQLYQQTYAYDPDTALQNAYAAYNGGGAIGTNCIRGAVCPSRDCPGQLQWQCQINQGGYVETENYVNNNINTVNRLNNVQEPAP